MLRITPVVLAIVMSCSKTPDKAIMGGETNKLTSATADNIPGDVDIIESVTQVTFTQVGDDKDPAVTPDNNTLFYSTNAHSKDFDIYRKKPGQSTAIATIMSEGSEERFPAVNPANPKELAFCSNKEGRWHIYVVADYTKHGSEWIRISSGDSDNIHPSFNSKGNKIVYCSSKEGDSWTIKIFDIERRETISPENLEGLLPEFAPDSDRIVFQRMRKTEKWLSEIWTCRITDENDVQDLLNVFSHKEWGSINPTWSMNGAKIIFCDAVAGKGSTEPIPRDLWIVDATGTNLMKLTNHKSSDWMPAGLKDSVYFASNRTGLYKIFSLKLQ